MSAANNEMNPVSELEPEGKDTVPKYSQPLTGKFPFTSVYSAHNRKEFFIRDEAIFVDKITKEDSTSELFKIHFKHGAFEWQVSKNRTDIENNFPSLVTDPQKKFEDSFKSYITKKLFDQSFANSVEMAKFMEVSKFSFVDDLGNKKKECLVRLYIAHLNSPTRTFKFVPWSLSICRSTPCDRWIIVKDSFIAVMNLQSHVIEDVILFDANFKLQHIAGQDKFTIKDLTCQVDGTSSLREVENLMTEINETLQNEGKLWMDSTIPYGSLFPVRQGSYAKWFVDGEDFFEYAVDMIENAKEEIFITDWWLTPELHMKRPCTKDNDPYQLKELLKRKAESGVHIFVLLYCEYSFFMNNGSEHAMNILSKIKNVKVIRHPDPIRWSDWIGLDWTKNWKALTNMWSHHEKLIVIDQNIAFIGGIDLCYGRWDNHQHRLADPESIYWTGKDYYNPIIKDISSPAEHDKDLLTRTIHPRMPWHDISVVVHGSAARDCARYFIKRWNCLQIKYQDCSCLLPKSYNNVEVPLPYQDESNSCTAQILTCCINDEKNDSIHQAYIDLIQNSKQFIYIENQFFISKMNDHVVKNRIAETLCERIIKAHKNKEKFRVYVVLPLLPSFEYELSKSTMEVCGHTYESLSKGPNSILERLSKEQDLDWQKYIGFYSLRTHDVLNGNLVTNLIYVHSKLLIIDDTDAIIGSANINDRSILGDRDSEVAVHINSLEFVKGLRQQLFREHLGLLKESCKPGTDISDPTTDEFYEHWRCVAKNNTEIYEQVFKCIPTDKVLTLGSLDTWNCNICKTNIMANLQPDEALKNLAKIKGHLVEFPLLYLSKSKLHSLVMKLPYLRTVFTAQNPPALSEDVVEANHLNNEFFDIC